MDKNIVEFNLDDFIKHSNSVDDKNDKSLRLLKNTFRSLYSTCLAKKSRGEIYDKEVDQLKYVLERLKLRGITPSIHLGNIIYKKA